MNTLESWLRQPASSFDPSWRPCRPPCLVAPSVARTRAPLPHQPVPGQMVPVAFRPFLPDYRGPRPPLLVVACFPYHQVPQRPLVVPSRPSLPRHRVPRPPVPVLIPSRPSLPHYRAPRPPVMVPSRAGFPRQLVPQGDDEPRAPLGQGHLWARTPGRRPPERRAMRIAEGDRQGRAAVLFALEASRVPPARQSAETIRSGKHGGYGL